jgi:hypothetical protein
MRNRFDRIPPLTREEVLENFYDDTCFAITLNRDTIFRPKKRLDIIEKLAIETQDLLKKFEEEENES